MRRHPRSLGDGIPPRLPGSSWGTGRRLIGFDEPCDNPPPPAGLLDEAIEQLYGGRRRDHPPPASIDSRRRG